MALTAANGTGASMWAGRRDEPPSTSWGGNREPGSAFRGTTTRGRGRGGGRARAGGRGGRPPSDRNGFEGGGESQRLSNTTGKAAPSNNTTVRTKQIGSSDAPTASEKTTSSRVDSSIPGQRKGESGDKNTRTNTNGLKDLPSQGSSQRSAKLKLSGASLQSTISATSSSSSKSSSRRRRGPGSRKSSISVKTPNALSSTPLPPSVPPTPLSATRDALQPFTIVESHSPMHDIRHDVDSLVDHVRTMAMEGNRSSSPATHIDWAGDDDDSLPDLEDWGISSNKVADIGDKAAKTDEPTKSEPATESEVDKVGDLFLSSSVGSMVVTSMTQGSTSSPIDSIPPSTSPTNSTARARGERKRERGRGREKEKKVPATAVSPSTSKSTLQNTTTTTPKKSLLERLSSPSRPVPISVPSRAEKSPIRTFNGVGESRSPASTLPFHPSLPPKPTTIPVPEGSPRRVNGLNFPPKPLSPWKSRHDDVAKVITPASFDTRQSAVQSTSQLTQPTSEAPEKTMSEKQPLEALKKAPEIFESKDTPISESKVPSFADAKDPSFLTSTSFDWSEEPTPFDPIFPQSSVILDIEPPTPLEELPSAHANVNLGSPGLSTMRTRAQRPLSGDITPRQRRERSPHKTHNARNHSAPSPGGLGATRTRTPHATRPIIRMDALAMISRSLRESPTPSRRESPAPSVVSAAE